MQRVLRQRIRVARRFVSSRTFQQDGHKAFAILKGQVLTVTGQIIPRLYAAGSTASGFIGPFYQHSGGGIAQAYTMGRVVGKYAVAEKPWTAAS